jgi:signal transduction histidine kinase
MRLSMQRQLSLYILAVLLLGMSLAGVLGWLTVERLFLENLSENLLAQASLAAAALQDLPLPAGVYEPYAQSANLLPGIHARLLGDQGGVAFSLPILADSAPVQAPLAENTGFVASSELRQRPEIQSALQGEPASAVRRVRAAGNRRVLYAAAPVYSEWGEITGIVYLATPLPPTRLPPGVVLQWVGAALVALLLAGALGIRLSRGIARPLENLAQSADAIAGGDLDQSVPVDAHIRELTSLGQAFNRMAASLRRVDQVKNAFLADVAHELRTPLTVIKGTVETLEDGALDDIEGRGPLLSSMHRETDRLIRLVNDLLVLARADAGALNLKVETLDLAELARMRCNQFLVLTAPRQVSIDVAVEGRTHVIGDPDRLSQVLDNLLDNAIRHAPQGSMVSVLIQGDGGVVRCAVCDQGPGIPAQHLPLIFERFYRADAARYRNKGGSGLGLAIVQSLVAAQGGGVSAESVEGQGAAISFWLPADPNCHQAA